MWNLIKSLRTENTIDNVNDTDEMIVSRRGLSNFYRLTLSQLKSYFTKNIVTDAASINTLNSSEIVTNAISTNFLFVGNMSPYIESISDITGVDVSTTLPDSIIININGTEYYIPVKAVS